ncbi:oligosaccharide flippase family protein [bacterium]|nr:MAG: oligosaccharide flippase family protein [bacterium]
MNNLVKQSLRILLGRASVSSIGLLFTVYFAYELPKNLFALIALYSTAASFTQVMIDLGLSAKMVREAPALIKDESRFSEVVRNVIMPSVMLRFFAAGITCIVMVIFLQLMEGLLSAEFPQLNVEFIILLAPISMMFENGNTSLASVFQVQRRFGTDSILTSGANLLEMIFATILYINFGMDQYFTGVLAAQASLFFIRSYLIRDVLRHFALKDLSLKQVKYILKEYWPYYLRRFFRFGLLQGEQLLVVILLPLAQLADFNLAKRLSKYLKFYSDAFSNPLTIKLARTKDLMMRKKHVRTFLFFTVPLPIALSLLSPWIMQLAGGDKYADSWPILAVLYLSYVFYGYSNLQMSVVTIFGKATEVLYRDAIGSIVGFTATLILILLFGQYGLAWGQLIAYFTLFIAGYHISKKYLDAEVESGSQKNESAEAIVPPDPE